MSVPALGEGPFRKPEMSATEAQIGLESKVAVQCKCGSKSEVEFALAPLAVDFDFECKFAFQHPKK